MKQLDTKLMHPADQLVLIISRIYRSGMTTTSGGNLSIMDDNGDIWITPAGIDKGSLRPQDIICVKTDGTIVGPHRPSSELPFHQALYKMRPKMKSVIHAHPPALVTFSIVHEIPNTSIIPQARVSSQTNQAYYWDSESGQSVANNLTVELDQAVSDVILENHPSKK